MSQATFACKINLIWIDCMVEIEQKRRNSNKLNNDATRKFMDYDADRKHRPKIKTIVIIRWCSEWEGRVSIQLKAVRPMNRMMPMSRMMPMNRSHRHHRTSLRAVETRPVNAFIVISMFSIRIFVLGYVYLQLLHGRF